MYLFRSNLDFLNINYNLTTIDFWLIALSNAIFVAFALISRKISNEKTISLIGDTEVKYNDEKNSDKISF